MYNMGNAKLNGNGVLQGDVSWLWFPSNSFTLQAYASYAGYFDRMVNTYDLFDGGKSVLHSFVNSGDFNRLSLGLNLTLRLFSNSLVLQGFPYFERSMSTGYYSMSHNDAGFRVNAEYYAGNFNFSGYYNARVYVMSVYTGEEIRNPSYYYLKAGWHNQSWNLSILANNFLRRNYKGQWSDLSTKDYRSHSTIFIPLYHAGITLEATYTFGYGKKVSRGNEVSAQWGAESAIMP